MHITDTDGKTITIMQLLQTQFPILFAVHQLGLDAMVGGGNEKKLSILIDVLSKYNQTKATGSIMIDYSKGRIANIDTKVRVTAGSAPAEEY